MDWKVKIQDTSNRLNDLLDETTKKRFYSIIENRKPVWATLSMRNETDADIYFKNRWNAVIWEGMFLPAHSVWWINDIADFNELYVISTINDAEINIELF